MIANQAEFHEFSFRHDVVAESEGALRGNFCLAR